MPSFSANISAYGLPRRVRHAAAGLSHDSRCQRHEASATTNNSGARGAAGRPLSQQLSRNDFSCRKSTLSLESLSARVDELERRLARLSPSGWARAAKADAEPSRRPAQLLAARDTSSNIQGNETICIAVPCAPKHWPLVPRVLRSVRQQSLQPQKVLVALSHTEPSDCEARQQELSRLHAGAELKCVGGSGWTRGHNRNVAAAACGNVTIIAYIDADDQMHPRRRR